MNIDWDKLDGLVPAIVQDAASGAVLMLGYMNRDALAATQATGQVTFWSRSKQRLWTKGETSGHFLALKTLALDCDQDALLVLASPQGPACHKGTDTCWGADAPQSDAQRMAFLSKLERIIQQRIVERPAGSYTAQLLEAGIARIAQKVGEEGVELALAAVAQSDSDLVGEAADLLFHAVLLLNARGLSLADVMAELTSRHGPQSRA